MYEVLSHIPDLAVLLSGSVAEADIVMDRRIGSGAFGAIHLATYKGTIAFLALC